MESPKHKPETATPSTKESFIEVAPYAHLARSNSTLHPPNGVRSLPRLGRQSAGPAAAVAPETRSNDSSANPKCRSMKPTSRLGITTTPTSCTQWGASSWAGFRIEDRAARADGARL